MLTLKLALCNIYDYQSVRKLKQGLIGKSSKDQGHIVNKLF